MTVYSRAEIEQFALNAGFEKALAKVFSFVALAESSGKSDAHNSYVEKGVRYDVWGLWQISTIHQADHPEWTRDWLLNPQNNAKAARTLQQASGMKPWESSRDGDNGWLKSVKNSGGPTLLEKVPILGDIKRGTDALVDTTTAVTDVLGDVGKAAWKAGGWLGNPHNWLRIAYVGLGAGTIIVGLAKLIGYDAGILPSKAMANLASGSKKAVSAGQAANVKRQRSGVGGGETLARGGHS